MKCPKCRFENRLRYKPPVAIGYLYLGEINYDSGQKEKAIKNLKKAENMFQEMEMDYWLARTKEVMQCL